MNLEKQIPELAEYALNQAYWQSLAEGETVLIVREGKLIEVSADGSEKIIKEIAKPVKVSKQSFKIPER